MVMLPTFLAGTNWVMHSAGWLEGGLVSSYEKFIIDIEILRMLQVEFTPIEFDDAALAFDAHQEVGHGGHFLGCQHTMERFRTCFYRPLLSSSDNFDRWKKNGGKDASNLAYVPLPDPVMPEKGPAVPLGAGVPPASGVPLVKAVGLPGGCGLAVAVARALPCWLATIAWYWL